MIPDWTVTVFAVVSSDTTSSIERRERKSCVLSAMVLKQWRVPRTLNFSWDLTKVCTWLDGGGGIKIVSAVDNVSGPVGELPGPGEQRGDGGLEDERGEEFEEGSLFHIFGDGRTV